MLGHRSGGLRRAVVVGAVPATRRRPLFGGAETPDGDAVLGHVMASTSGARLLVLAICGLALVGCGQGDVPAATNPSVPALPAAGFRSVECNGVTDADVAAAIKKPSYAKVVSTDVGCFWQENTAI